MMAMAIGNEGPQEHDAPAAPALRPLALLALGLAAFVGVFGIGWAALSATQASAVTHLQIEGRFTHLQVADLDAAIRPLAERRFGELDLAAVRTAVEALPWTARASVERVWPGTLRVRVVERVALARWNEASLLDTESRPFTPPAEELPPDLPQLAGPSGTEAAVSAMYATLVERLRHSAFALQGLAQDARGEWTARTSDGVALRFGREDPLIKLNILLGPAERVLKNRMSEVKDLDLRYTNGFSVNWQPPGQSPAQKEGG